MPPNPFGIRGYLIDAPVYGSLRSHRDGAIVIENGKIAEVGAYDDLRKRQRAALVRWTDRGTVAVFPGLIDCPTHLHSGALCIYRCGPQANLETYVRGKCVYLAPELTARG